MDSDTLKRLQRAELDILIDIDEYCKNGDIKYSLDSGTLLGAARHKGFIPWDDDIDIIMTRTEYSRFCELWKNNPLDGYYFENFENDDYTQNMHGKIRKNGTVFLSDIEDIRYGHHGIWIDIFILDKISKDKRMGNRIIELGRKAIILTKANGTFPGEGKVKKIVRNAIKLLYPRERRKQLLLNILKALKQNDEMVSSNYELCNMCTLEYLNVRFPEETAERYSSLLFEGKEFPVFSNYDKILRTMYGDYMSLPPKEERVCKHMPKEIKFDQ